MTPKTNAEAVKNLLDLLKLKKNGEDIFTGPINQEDWARVFGGQVIAQALLSACETIDDGRMPHSLHAYFIRPGRQNWRLILMFRVTAMARVFLFAVLRHHKMAGMAIKSFLIWHVHFKPQKTVWIIKNICQKWRHPMNYKTKPHFIRNCSKITLT